MTDLAILASKAKRVHDFADEKRKLMDIPLDPKIAVEATRLDRAIGAIEIALPVICQKLVLRKSPGLEQSVYGVILQSIDEDVQAGDRYLVLTDKSELLEISPIDPKKAKVYSISSYLAAARYDVTTCLYVVERELDYIISVQCG